MNNETLNEYKKWLNEPSLLEKDRIALKELKNEEEINDAFYQNLAFGTGGLRGVIGIGTNRMNEYTVKKATQGLANYLNKTCKSSSVAISYDSRNFSKEFAFLAAEVLSSNNIKVYIYKELKPTPVLSFTTRYLKCSAGIMITASHNPKQYNGYKVYGADGCQITDNFANDVSKEINAINIFNDVKCFNKSLINYVPNEVYEAFLSSTKNKSLLSKDIKRDVKIIYTPLNGTGNIPVRDILRIDGFNDVIVVKEQELPDGNFTTCPYPNPEIKTALDLGVQCLKENNADVLLATDPDCDRIGLVSLDKEGVHYYSGNEVGILLFDYIYETLKANNNLPKNPVIVKTIVTTDMMNAIANKLGIEVIDVLTGFKYIGETIANLEKEGRIADYLLGLEESCGYLTNTDVRDKDAVNASMLVAEMVAYNKSKSLTPYERLNELYKEYGFYKTELVNYEFPGESGKTKIQNTMSYLRENVLSLNELKIRTINDYHLSISKIDDKEVKINLPKSNVLKYIFVDGTTLTVRPSGTEPKIKLYFCSKSEENISVLKIKLNEIIMGE